MSCSQRYKVVLVGDKGVGKRSLLRKAFQVPRRYSPFYIPIEFVEAEGRDRTGQVKIHFYDSLVNGIMVRQNDSLLVRQFCSEVINDAHAVLFCFAFDNSESLANLREWVTTVKNFIGNDTRIYLVGTKSDTGLLIDERVYKSISKQIEPCGTFSVSSFTGENLETLFANVLSGFVKFPFVLNKSQQIFDLKSTSQEAVSPKESINLQEVTNSLGLVTPPKRTTCHEIASSEGVPSRGITVVKQNQQQQVRARAADNTDDSLIPRSSYNSFAWKQDKRSIMDTFHKMENKWLDQDFTELEEGIETQLEYLKVESKRVTRELDAEALNPDRIDVNKIDSKKNSVSGLFIKSLQEENTKEGSRAKKEETIEIGHVQENFCKDSSARIQKHLQIEPTEKQVPQISNQISLDKQPEDDLENNSRRIIKIWF